MATSRNTEYRAAGNSFHSYLDGLPELSRYDVVLAAIPFAFALSLVGVTLLSIPLRPAIVASSLVSSLLLADAIFVNPPGTRPENPR